MAWIACTSFHAFNFESFLCFFLIKLLFYDHYLLEIVYALSFLCLLAMYRSVVFISWNVPVPALPQPGSNPALPQPCYSLALVQPQPCSSPVPALPQPCPAPAYAYLSGAGNYVHSWQLRLYLLLRKLNSTYAVMRSELIGGRISGSFWWWTGSLGSWEMIW